MILKPALKLIFQAVLIWACIVIGLHVGLWLLAVVLT